MKKVKLVKIIHPPQLTIYFKDEYRKSFLGDTFQFKGVEVAKKCDSTGKCKDTNVLVFNNKFAEAKYLLDFAATVGGFGKSFLKETSFRIFREFSPLELGVGGSPENIDVSLNGQKMDKLESKMRPFGKNDEVFESSSVGFINESESLSSVLQEDDTFVRSKGLAHKDLAYPLKYFFKLYRRLMCSSESLRKTHNAIDVQYKGAQFRLSGESFLGCQYSPFNDGICTRDDITITNLNNGKTITYSAMLPYLIERYGFYEGHTPYRISPSEIIDVLNLSRENSAPLGPVLF